MKRHWNIDARRGLAVTLLMAAFLPGVLPAQETAKLVPALGWDIAQQSAFPTCIASDAQNAVWVGTEDKGVWRYDPRAKKWSQFLTKDGLGDDHIYALAVDKLNRVWAGHLNHGVSVWNGEKWRNYGLLEGPLGDRVFSIATCPKDGDVWMATDCGLARYSVSKDEWDYFSRASGLPSNQIQCITFDSDGNIYAGTQCDGITMASAADNYKKWRTVTGPLQMPVTGYGDGLSTSIINGIANVQQPPGMYHGSAETVAAATPLGICVSADHGQKWSFMRGADWQKNVNGLYDRQEALEGAEDPAQQQVGEDWMTCISQEPETKRIWYGYRQKGVEARNANGSVLIRTDMEGSDSSLVRSILARPKTPPLFAVYDDAKGGLKTLDSAKETLEPGTESPKTAPALPAPAKSPDAPSLAAIAKQINLFKNPLVIGDAVFLGDDWRTGGDWISRYGNSYAMLCGVEANGRVFASETGYEIGISPGTQNAGAEGGMATVRGRVFLNGNVIMQPVFKTRQVASSTEPGANTHVSSATSDDTRAPYDPTTGHRVDAEVHDFTAMRNSYPFSVEGPDLWVDAKIPEGIHCLSLYFYNNDSQKGHWNKFRDYDIQVLPWDENRDTARKATPVARARVCDFYGGVYKEFIINGPAHYLVRIARNRSFVTKLQGVFLDRLSGPAPENKKALPGFDKVEYNAPALENFTPPAEKPLFTAAYDLWSKMDEIFDKRGVIGLQIPLRVWAYRAAAADGAPVPLLTSWRWQFAYWTPEDRAGFKEAMARAFEVSPAAKDTPAPAAPAIQTGPPANGN